TLLLQTAAATVVGQSPDALDAVLADQQRRIDMIARVSPSVVCVFDANLRGGGSGVLIDAEGYGLTNFHVVAGLLKTRKGWGGLGDGVLYELEVLGIDVTGDVAMFRLIPPKTGYKFPHSPLGDSDALRIGDPAIAMGNPFILSGDYTPTVTMGLITGLHRYQRGVRGNLTYTDCIQVDTAINPGNSGGPLFNLAGEVVGINGRISVNRERSRAGRYNVGFGYAIASKQIRRFIPALRAGLLARHGSWQARVEDVHDGGVRFSLVRPSGPAYAAGLRVGDTLRSIDATAIHTANQVASLLGTYPAGWPVVLDVEQNGHPARLVVRLDPVQPRMPKPYKEITAVNQRRIRRVLRRFQRAVLGTDGGRPPAAWRWNTSRCPFRDGAGDVKPCAQYVTIQSGDGPFRRQRRYDDGSTGGVLEYNATTVTQRTSPDAAPVQPPADLQALHRALFTIQRTWLEPVDAIDLEGVRHVGGDALVREPPSATPGPTAGDSDGIEGTAQNHTPAEATGKTLAGDGSRLLEVIEWPLGDQASALIALDAATFHVMRITLHDELSGADVVVRLGGHRDVGGLVWPTIAEVEGPGYHYIDTGSAWEVSP
ncbi:MAG: S1C family serine protease, partial [Phycisphaerae bacterium]